MKHLHLHHIEICTQNLERVVGQLVEQFRFTVVGNRETLNCSQTVLQSGQTIFIVTFRKVIDLKTTTTSVTPSAKFIYGEPWTNFCCIDSSTHKKNNPNENHIDSVFNIALRVEDLMQTLQQLSKVTYKLIQAPVNVGSIKYAIITSICGDVVHTLIEKSDIEFGDWFLPGFTRLQVLQHGFNSEDYETTTHLDHVAFVCHSGEIDTIIKWYEEAFGMKRFITNRSDDGVEGLVIKEDVGMRLKVMEFWLCSEIGVSSSRPLNRKGWNVFKLVVGESLPHIKNTQIENFLRDHNGPGLQHIGLHSSDIVKTVELMSQNGVKFRQPPSTYYTKVGQLETVLEVGEDVESLSRYGILLDNEADTFDDDDVVNLNERYLMQIFTYPIFDKDTFFFEVIQRKGARGFGVGNVTALARSVDAYQKQMKIKEGQQ